MQWPKVEQQCFRIINAILTLREQANKCPKAAPYNIPVVFS